MCFEPLRVTETPSPASEQADLEPVSEPIITAAPPGRLESVDVTAEAGSPGTDVPETDVPRADVAEAPASGSTWTCRTCENVNPMSIDACTVCGTTIFQTMGAETDEITLSQDQGLRLGLVPGLAHGRLGEPVLGFIIALLVLACVAFAVVFIQSGGAVWGLIVGLVGLLTWVVSIVDVNQRIAGATPLLRPRVMTILGGVVILVIMVAGFVAGATAVRSPGS